MIEKPSLYVCSTSGLSGKSVISLGLALNFQDRGYNVGYFKPIGWEAKRNFEGKKVDEDAELMASVLNLSLESVVPIIFSPRFYEETGNTNVTLYEAKIIRAFEKIAKDKDLVIVEGPPSLATGSSMSLDSISLLKKIKSPVLMVSRFQNDISIDSAVWIKNVLDVFGLNFLGLILNRILNTDFERIKRFARARLENCGIDLQGIVPETAELIALSARDICSAIRGQVLTAANKLDNPVEDILVGAMSPKSGLSYFRKSCRKAVITGGDRADIQTAALETSLSALILTGGFHPDARVLAHAEEVGVPVLLVPGDTYSTVRRISSLIGRIHAKNHKKIAVAKKLVQENVDWKKILDVLI